MELVDTFSNRDESKYRFINSRYLFPHYRPSCAPVKIVNIPLQLSKL